MSYVPNVAGYFGEKKESNRGIIIAIVIGVLLLLIGLGVGAYFLFSSSNSTTTTSSSGSSGGTSGGASGSTSGGSTSGGASGGSAPAAPAAPSTPSSPPSSSTKVLGKYENGAAITLQGDNGLYLSRCTGCVPDTGSSGTSDSPFSKWIIGQVSGNKITLKAWNGQYLSRCNGCVPGASAELADAAFASSTDPNASFSQWTMIDVGNGKVALQADTGKFLARCSGCSPKGSIEEPAFIHTADKNAAYAQWTVAVK